MIEENANGKEIAKVLLIVGSEVLPVSPIGWIPVGNCPAAKTISTKTGEGHRLKSEFL
ncbi:hypothetical protein BH20BAC1_BH20BAC1_20690 [soil metagenome]